MRCLSFVFLICVPLFAHASDDFAWSYRGPLANYSQCVQWIETAEPRETTWRDNYLCHNTGFDMRWSSAGPISGMECAQINEPQDPHTWRDNFLCIERDAPFSFKFNSRRPILGSDWCEKIEEPSDPASWNNNFLCFFAKRDRALETKPIAPKPGIVAGVSIKAEPSRHHQGRPAQNRPYRLSLNFFDIIKEEDRREDLYLIVQIRDGNDVVFDTTTRTFLNLNEGNKYRVWSPNVVLYNGRPSGRLVMAVHLYDAKTNGHKRAISITKWSTKGLATIAKFLDLAPGLGTGVSLGITAAGEIAAEQIKRRGPGKDTPYGTRVIAFGSSDFPFQERETTFVLNFQDDTGRRDYNIDVGFVITRTDIPPAPEVTEDCRTGFICREPSADGSSCLRGFCVRANDPFDRSRGVISVQ